MNNLFFTSDEHIDHRNIIKFCDRPFFENAAHTSLYIMREGLIARHNSVVGPEDVVHHLGDMFWRTLSLSEAISIMNRLNGVHHYTLGNHEELMEEPALRACFVDIAERRQIYPEGAPNKGIVLDHYAGRVWHDSDKGSWQLYGHSHNDLPEIDPLLSFDVGVDANGYYPVPLEEVKKRMEMKTARIVRSLGLPKKP